MAFDYVSHVCSAAVADLEVVSIEYLFCGANVTLGNVCLSGKGMI